MHQDKSRLNSDVCMYCTLVPTCSVGDHGTLQRHWTLTATEISCQLYCVVTICPLPFVYHMQALTAWTTLRPVDVCIYVRMPDNLCTMKRHNCCTHFVLSIHRTALIKQVFHSGEVSLVRCIKKCMLQPLHRRHNGALNNRDTEGKTV